MNLSINLLCLMAKSMNMISEERPVLCLIRYEEVFKEEMNTNYALIDFKITSAKAHQNQFASQNHRRKTLLEPLFSRIGHGISSFHTFAYE